MIEQIVWILVVVFMPEDRAVIAGQYADQKSCTEVRVIVEQLFKADHVATVSYCAPWGKKPTI